MIYLASPYTHPDPFVREMRYVSTMKVLVEQYLLKARWAYSPIVHCHELAKIGDLPKDGSFWKQYDFHMLELAEELHILRLDGWTSSEGIKNELTHFMVFHKPGRRVEYI